MSFAKHLPKIAKYSVSRITLGVTEKTARKVLKIKKDQPLQYKGIPLNCIGSEAYRKRHGLNGTQPATGDEALT